MIRLYIIGLAILIIAILANGIVVKLGVKSWYDFISLITDGGFSAFSKLSAIDYFWLFVGYPLVLGFGYWIGNQLSQLILK